MMVPRFHGSMVRRFHGSMVRSCDGSMVPRFHALMVVLFIAASLACAAQPSNSGTVAPTTVEPTTVAPTTVEPTTVAPTTVAPPTTDTTYRVELHLIGGFGGTKYVEPPSRYSTRESFFGYNVNARVMWHPDHLLSVGVMSGYQVFSREIFSAENHDALDEDLRLELSSVPIHLAFEVRPLNIRFGAGIGAYLLLSQLEERNQITHSWDVAYGGSAWIGYAFEPVPRIRIGPDVVLQVLSDRGIANLSAMITLQYDFFVY